MEPRGEMLIMTTFQALADDAAHVIHANLADVLLQTILQYREPSEGWIYAALASSAFNGADALEPKDKEMAMRQFFALAVNPRMFKNFVGDLSKIWRGMSTADALLGYELG